MRVKVLHGDDRSLVEVSGYGDDDTRRVERKCMLLVRAMSDDPEAMRRARRTIREDFNRVLAAIEAGLMAKGSCDEEVIAVHRVIMAVRSAAEEAFEDDPEEEEEYHIQEGERWRPRLSAYRTPT